MMTDIKDSEVILALGLVSEAGSGLHSEDSERNSLLGRSVWHQVQPGLWIHGFGTSTENFAWTDDPSKNSSLEWVGPRILCFDAALRELGLQQTVWPFGFPCLFSSWVQVENILQPHLDTLFRFFAKYRNRLEYNLLLHSQEKREKIAPPKEFNGGGNYLRLKQKAAMQTERSQAEFQEFADKIRRYLNSIDIEWREKSVGTILSSQKIARHFVIAASGEAMEHVQADISRLADAEGMKISVTGPWPLISFIERIHADGRTSRPNQPDLIEIQPNPGP